MTDVDFFIPEKLAFSRLIRYNCSIEISTAAMGDDHAAARPNGRGSAQIVYRYLPSKRNTASDTLTNRECLMSVSKSTRFEVFKRDSFTCQYCGRSAPEAVLEADHIHPVSEGGTDDLFNLVTSCKDCNSGKSNRLLSDDTVIQKRKKMLDDLQERREQLEMLMEWQRSLIQLADEEVEQLHEFWQELTPGYSLKESGLKSLERWKKKFSLIEVLEAMRIAADQYLIFDATAENPNKPTQESVEKSFNYIPRIMTTRRREKDNPIIKDLYYIRGILRKRISYVNEWKTMELLQVAVDADYPIEDLRELAKQVKNWTEFRTTMEAIIGEEDGGDE